MYWPIPEASLSGEQVIKHRHSHMTTCRQHDDVDTTSRNHGDCLNTTTTTTSERYLAVFGRLPHTAPTTYAPSLVGCYLSIIIDCDRRIAHRLNIHNVYLIIMTPTYPPALYKLYNIMQQTKEQKSKRAKEQESKRDTLL